MADICEHHVLRRSCQQCDDKETIDDLKAQVEELTDKYVSEAQDLVTEQLANDKLHDEIADLKAQVAEKDRVIEVLAKYYCMVHNTAVNTGEEILPHEIIKEAEAEAKAKETSR